MLLPNHVAFRDMGLQLVFRAKQAFGRCHSTSLQTLLEFCVFLANCLFLLLLTELTKFPQDVCLRVHGCFSIDYSVASVQSCIVSLGEIYNLLQYSVALLKLPIENEPIYTKSRKCFSIVSQECFSIVSLALRKNVCFSIIVSRHYYTEASLYSVGALTMLFQATTPPPFATNPPPCCGAILPRSGEKNWPVENP